jgi:anti-sigma regulatory factor (Ser/Thr protein kinase)
MNLPYQLDTSTLDRTARNLALELLAERLRDFPKSSKAILFPCIMELVDNVYAHASALSTDIVEWSLRITTDNSGLTVVVTDSGQGIPNSIRGKLGNRHLTSCEAIKIAVTGEFADGRGRGLSSIRQRVDAGHISSLGIETELGLFFRCGQTEAFEQFESAKEGTRITLHLGDC